VAEVLRPRLEALGVEPSVIGQVNKRVPDRMRIEIRQAGERASFLKDCPNRVRIRRYTAAVVSIGSAAMTPQEYRDWAIKQQQLRAGGTDPVLGGQQGVGFDPSPGMQQQPGLRPGPGTWIAPGMYASIADPRGVVAPFGPPQRAAPAQAQARPAQATLQGPARCASAVA
jgi:hypothetical protein